MVGIVLRKKKKKCLESFKSTPFDCVRYFLSPQMRGSVCIGPLVHRVSVRGQPAATQRASSQSLRVSLPDRPLRLHDRICCFALWSIKIWEVHSSRRPIHSRAHSVKVFFNGLARWSEKQQGLVCNDPVCAPEFLRPVAGDVMWGNPSFKAVFKQKDFQ